MTDKSAKTMHPVPALTAALEDYLEAIYNLCRMGEHAHSRDIAESLGVHKSTVTAALKSLSHQGFINYSPYEAVTLTPEGEGVAKDVVRRHKVLKDFFTGVLVVDADTAEKAACGMEHAIPRAIVDKLVDFADFIKHCPCVGENWLDAFTSGQASVRCQMHQAAGSGGNKKKRD